MKSMHRQSGGAVTSIIDAASSSGDALGADDDDILDRHIAVPAAVAGLHAFDRIDHLVARDHLGEHRVAPADGVSDVKFRKLLFVALMKNWLVAECGTEVRAIASV
jgi:hypothetical protein